jgi:hypothetical protein
VFLVKGIFNEIDHTSPVWQDGSRGGGYCVRWYFPAKDCIWPTAGFEPCLSEGISVGLRDRGISD